MPKHKYTLSALERANWWLVRAEDTLTEANVLIKESRTRIGARNRLYYTAHHIARALLELSGKSPRSHTNVISQFGLHWVKTQKIPSQYGRLLNTLYSEREVADYGESIPTFRKSIEATAMHVLKLYNRARRIVPVVSFAQLLSLVIQQNQAIRDLSFDVYCPKSYYHHTRFTVWFPKGRFTERWFARLRATSLRMLKDLGIKESGDYVLGLNSRVNQYTPQHLLLLDIDDISTLPFNKFKGEPGYFLRTASGFHFIGSQLYDYPQWRVRMKKYYPFQSKQHTELSLKRGYSTLRVTKSARKNFVPTYIGRS